MLIAVKTNQKRVDVYHWRPGSCATLNSESWLGWTTANASSHPAQSENEFIHKCLTEPGDFFIKADEEGILVKQNEEIIYNVEF